MKETAGSLQVFSTKVKYVHGRLILHIWPIRLDKVLSLSTYVNLGLNILLHIHLPFFIPLSAMYSIDLSFYQSVFILPVA